LKVSFLFVHKYIIYQNCKNTSFIPNLPKIKDEKARKRAKMHFF
jgi:hypothetical protein